MSTEELIIYGFTFLVCLGIVFYYVYRGSKRSKEVQKKVAQAKEDGRFEPVSLHPYIDLNTCIGSGACVTACPEQDILGLIDGQATVINASSCIGHGACFHACPVDAISLRIGTEKRGVDLPHVKPSYETNINGIYIAGELGGMGLIKNSAEQGVQAVENIARLRPERSTDEYDLLIIGAGPAGIAGALTAKSKGLKFKIVDQDSLGGTVFTFPRSKVVMTKPMNLPLYGKLKLVNTSKEELLSIWNDALGRNEIEVEEHCEIDQIIPEGAYNFKVVAKNEKVFRAKQVLIAIGRRGTPRKLNIPGEQSTKVAYRLLEPETIEGEKIVIVGGGDSAVESAMLLMDHNEVHLSYRKEKFGRIKTQNRTNLDAAVDAGKIKLLLGSNLKEIRKEDIVYTDAQGEECSLLNDRVYIFAGGELPISFLQKAGIEVDKKFGKIVKRH
jgi:thioredoxin reductase (NADPH)